MEINFTPKNADFYCSFCDFKCFKQSDWVRHIKTNKHIYRVNGNNMETAEIKKYANYICECGKIFLTSSGLWKHKKKCTIEQQSQIKNNNEISDKELILMLIKENSQIVKENNEFKNLMMKVLENGTHNTTTTHTNSHNKSFNLQFFLNETCKDAMNIMDFVNSIQLQLSDLERVGELGYVEGISNIIVKNLKELDVTQRPIHCADKKREVLYVKDEDKWEKEDQDKNKIRKAIKRVVSKNLNLLPKFKEEHPDCNKASSKFSDQYNKIIVESCGGSGENDSQKEDKIIKNISKNVTIEKVFDYIDLKEK